MGHGNTGNRDTAIQGAAHLVLIRAVMGLHSPRGLKQGRDGKSLEENVMVPCLGNVMEPVSNTGLTLVGFPVMSHRRLVRFSQISAGTLWVTTFVCIVKQGMARQGRGQWRSRTCTE